jgi:DNA-binding transcriptional ArsR family regulator
MRDDFPVDDILAALSDPVRRRMLDLIADRGEATATMLATAVDITRQGVTKHLMVLERAELVVSRRAGREVLYRIRPEHLAATAHWLDGLSDRWGHRLAAIKRIAESNERAPGSELT